MGVNLVQAAEKLMHKGIYDPDQMFKIMYARFPVHYARVREAIHEAKTK